MITADELMHSIHHVSDEDLNWMIYMMAKDAVETGSYDEWPKDDIGFIMWFVSSFITDEMRSPS